MLFSDETALRKGYISIKDTIYDSFSDVESGGGPIFKVVLEC